jgi:RNA polymerase sigma-70 factor (ECF subfamily)
MLDPQETRLWFERVVEENYRMLYGIAFNILRHAQSAEDATQEAVLRAYSQIGTLDNPQTVAGWLARITQNVARDMRKKHAPVLASALQDGEREMEHPAPTRETGILELEEERGALRDEVAKLSPDQCAVVTMRYMEDLDIQQISERLGKKPNAVAALLHRSRAALKKALKKRSGRLKKGTVTHV